MADSRKGAFAGAPHLIKPASHEMLVAAIADLSARGEALTRFAMFKDIPMEITDAEAKKDF